MVPSQQDGEVCLDLAVSPGSRLLRAAFLLLRDPCLMARGIIFFQLKCSQDLLDLAFLDSLVGQERRKRREDERGKELISRQSAPALFFPLTPDECHK